MNRVKEKAMKANGWIYAEWVCVGGGGVHAVCVCVGGGGSMKRVSIVHILSNVNKRTLPSGNSIRLV